MLCEMQTVSSRNGTSATEFISFDGNRYTTCVSIEILDIYLLKLLEQYARKSSSSEQGLQSVKQKNEKKF